MRFSKERTDGKASSFAPTWRSTPTSAWESPWSFWEAYPWSSLDELSSPCHSYWIAWSVAAALAKAGLSSDHSLPGCTLHSSIVSFASAHCKWSWWSQDSSSGLFAFAVLWSLAMRKALINWWSLAQPHGCQRRSRWHTGSLWQTCFFLMFPIVLRPCCLISVTPKFPKELPWGATMGFLAGFKKSQRHHHQVHHEGIPWPPCCRVIHISSTRSFSRGRRERYVPRFFGRDNCTYISWFFMRPYLQEHIIKTQYLFASCLVNIYINSVIDIGYQRATAYCTRFLRPQYIQ